MTPRTFKNNTLSYFFLYFSVIFLILSFAEFFVFSPNFFEMWGNIIKDPTPARVLNPYQPIETERGSYPSRRTVRRINSFFWTYHFLAFFYFTLLTKQFTQSKTILKKQTKVVDKTMESFFTRSSIHQISQLNRQNMWTTPLHSGYRALRYLMKFEGSDEYWEISRDIYAFTQIGDTVEIEHKPNIHFVDKLTILLSSYEPTGNEYDELLTQEKKVLNVMPDYYLGIKLGLSIVLIAIAITAVVFVYLVTSY